MKNLNSVILLGYYGGDEVNACSAWTSTSRELTEDKKNRIGKLFNGRIQMRRCEGTTSKKM